MRSVELGLRENAGQFWLLVLVNAFVGGMVGLERELLPLLGEREFGVASKVALLSFIGSFGAIKALSNYVAGTLGDAWGRRKILIAGWLFGLPVPWLIIFAPTWGWIVLANIFLGLNQGLAWSSTVVMKIDLVGQRQRGLAMGLNEFAGYLALALSALGAGLIAQKYELRPAPFYLGVAFSVAGLLLSIFFVRDTRAHLVAESSASAAPAAQTNVFAAVTWKDPSLSSCSQAGLFNNLNDGFAWGLFPLLFAAAGLAAPATAVLVAVYPAAWGVTQLVTGPLSDRLGRKPMIVSGMVVQAAALAMIALTGSFDAWFAGSVALGIGTAMVYPTLLAAISDVAHPSWRASAVGVYRLWRDSGYVFGAFLGGAVAGAFGIRAALLTAAVLTLLSGLGVAVRMTR